MHPELSKGHGSLELDKALLVELEQAEEMHHQLHAGPGRSGRPGKSSDSIGKRDAERLDDLGDGDLVDKNVIDLDVRRRPRASARSAARGHPRG